MAEAHDHRRKAARAWRDLADAAELTAQSIEDGEPPAQLLEELEDAADWLEDARTQTVRYAHATGLTWAEVGAALGVRRQSAWSRYAER